MTDNNRQRKEAAIKQLTDAILSGDIGVESEAEAREHAEQIWDQAYFVHGASVAEGACLSTVYRYRSM